MRGTAGYSDSQVFNDCKRIKFDLEERAKTLMQLPGISKKDLSSVEINYRSVSKEIEAFSFMLEQDVLDAEEQNTPLDVTAFDNEHCEDIAELYKMYNDDFLVGYETIVGKNIKSLAIRNCQADKVSSRSLLSVNLNSYKAFRDNNLRPQAWSKL